MLDLEVAAAGVLKSRERKFSHDRSLTVGASDIGRCARSVWFEKKLGREGWDEDYIPSWGAAARGDILEEQWSVPVIRKAVEAAGGELIWAGSGNQHTIEVLNWRMSATPDGLGINLPTDFLAKYGVSDLLGTSCVIEIKSFSPLISKWNLPKPEHVDQVVAQIGLIKKEGTHDPKWGLIVYVNAANVEDIRAFPVMFPRQAFEGMIRRAIAIFSATDADQLRPEGLIAGKKECEYCPFKKRCSGYTKSVPKENRPMADIPSAQRAMIRAAATKLHNVRQEMTFLVAKEEGARAMLKEAMSRSGTRYVNGNTFGYGKDEVFPFEVTWRVTKPRVTWDEGKLASWIEESGKQVSDFQKTGKPGDVLIVKVKDDTLEQKKLARQRDNAQTITVNIETELEEPGAPATPTEPD